MTKPNILQNENTFVCFSSAFRTNGRGDEFVNRNNGSSKPQKAKMITENHLTDLFQYDMPCICCNIPMIDPKEIDYLKNINALKCDSPKAIKLLSPYEQNMHDVEKNVFKKLRYLSSDHPEKNFQELLSMIKPDNERYLLAKQLGVFRLIDNKSLFFERETRKEILNLMSEQKDLLYKGKNEFRRQTFIRKLEEVTGDYRDQRAVAEILQIAENLPSAKNDVDSFIVKYADKPSDKIAFRLLDYSIGTIEHIQTDSSGGTDKGKNNALECMKCNHTRGNDDLKFQLEKNPSMFANAQRQMDKLINLANQGLLDKEYIVHLKKAYEQKTDNILQMDISKLKIDQSIKKILNKPVDLIDRKKRKRLRDKRNNY